MRHWKFSIDLTAFLLAVLIAFWLRFDFRIGIVVYAYPQSVFWGSVIDTVLGTLFLLYYKPYRNIWRHTGFKEVWEIARLIFWQKTLFALAVVSLVPTVFPRSIFIIAPLVSLSIMIVPRFVVRFYTEGRFRYLRKTGKRTLIIGAGEAGAQICREIAAHSELGYQLVGFVDDDRRKQQAFLHGFRVLGQVGDLPGLVVKQRIETVIVAVPSAGRSLIKKVYELTATLPVETLIMPGIYEMIGKKVSFSTLRPFKIEDLLLREPVFMDGGKIARAFSGKRVLVTGA
ncbi:MAG TPA: Gfo/Idh/MocA family oxidoreductase, partial [Atribacteraceae bacterium]|nr:Gfo/Idh/MocA family oxidoreductase [Atribacteraceae bacterium]